MKVIGNLTKDAIIRAAVSQGSSATEAIGSEAVFESATTSLICAAYDSNENKTVIVYRDNGNSNYGTAVVATVSGNSISYGTPVVFEAATTGHTSVAFDSNSNKIVIAYADSGNSNYGTAIVGTVSGTSISFGTPVVYNAGTTAYNYVVFDSSNNKIVICYQDTSNSQHGTAIVGTVSGTSISFGSEVVFESAETSYISAAFDSNLNKVVIAYQDTSNSSHGTAIVGTVSGTSISFGSATVFESAGVSLVQAGFDSTNNKIVIGYYDGGNSYYGTAIVGTVSGTSISFGTAVVFQSSQSNVYSIVHDSNAQKTVIFFRDQANSQLGTVIAGTVSGTSISFDTKFVVNNASTEGHTQNAVFDSTAKKIVIAYRDDGNSSYGEAVVYQTGFSVATGGTIADGKPVIVNANGTVSSVSESAASAGTTVTFSASNCFMRKDGSVYDSSNNKVVIGFKDNTNSQRGTALVGTVDNSDNSITFGSAVVFETGVTDHITSTFDSNSNKVIFAYTDEGNSNYGTAVVGTVSGTSISFGTPVVFESGSTIGIGMTFDTNSNKVVISYSDQTGGQDGTAVVGTVSGTSISFGSPVKFEVGNVDYTSATFDSSNNKVVISFSDNANSNYGTAIVGTVSGTSISFGSAVVFASEYTVFNPIVFDSSNNKVVVSYRAGTDGDKGKSVVGTVSGTSISFGSVATFNNAAMSEMSAAFDTSLNQVVIAYKDTGNSNQGTAIAGTVSGTSISFGSELIYQTGAVADNTLVYDTNANRFAVFYRDNGSPYAGKATVFNFSITNVTTENFVGFMKGAALDGTNGEILSSCSIARNQTSLTPGQTYFVTPTGALSLTAGSPSVTAGTAISNTELIVKG